ncbi:MAG: NAD(P)/FAD-dependent oxidoreductase [Candidatus Omnitrophota bacterium]
MSPKKIIVVGAGPAGLMAAIRAGQLHQEVTLLEKNPAAGKKLLLSGKGRCNLTNAAGLDLFLKRFFSGGQFLRDSFSLFFNRQLIDFFQSRGLRLKIERQDRVFPSTDSSASVLAVLTKELKEAGVCVTYNCTVKALSIRERRIHGVILKDGAALKADRVILSTGGLSYAFTGSCGDGLRMAQACGHRIVPTRAGLVPLKASQKYVRDLEGLTLKNIRITFSDGKKKIVSEIGELLFTDSGISGPLVLTHSGSIVDWLRTPKPVHCCVDLKPALSLEQLDNRLLREFSSHNRKSLKNALQNLLPRRMVAVILAIAGVGGNTQSNQVTAGERRSLVRALKSFKLDIVNALPIEEAMITRGGVSLKDINPRTQESRIVKGLYFAGEMIDVDADTGGFNLQAAFSTGYLAGESAAQS